MAFNHTLSAILRGSWMLDRQWAVQHIPVVIAMLKGMPVSFATPSRNDSSHVKSSAPIQGWNEIQLPFAIDPSTGRQSAIYAGRGSMRADIAPNSVAVIPISGPVTKYNGECGEAGTLQLAQYIRDMNSLENIGSILFVMDTPGGETRAINAFTSAIASTNKPTLTFVQGYCASLGAWMSSATDEVYLSSQSDFLGSIGSYCHIIDFSGMMEKEGIKVTEIYAPQSTEKNIEYREAIAGNTSLIEEDLRINVDQFISFVKANRGDKAAASSKEWSTGKLFYAEDAVRLGLADGIRSFEQVVSKAAWLGKRKKSN